MNSYEDYLAGVKEKTVVIKDIPRRYRHYELLTAACSGQLSFLNCLKKNIREEILYHYAILNDTITLQDIPVELRTNRICTLVVTRDGANLEFVPQQFKTYEMCKIAVTSNSHALKFFPSIYSKHPSLIDIAVKNHLV